MFRITLYDSLSSLQLTIFHLLSILVHLDDESQNVILNVDDKNWHTQSYPEEIIKCLLGPNSYMMNNDESVSTKPVLRGEGESVQTKTYPEPV